ncbi:DUF192 domain-containing protein [bacterium]|nr:DUF192 domain-containing protein [bacterium]
MPIINASTGEQYPLTLTRADRLLPRLMGLLGTESLAGEALHLTPCDSIHTIGMKYSLDIVYLDSGGRVLKTVSSLRPNRVSSGPSQAASVLELPAGYAERHGIGIGDRLTLVPDSRNRTSQHALTALFHWPINVFLGILWSRFILHSIESWLASSGPLTLGIVIHNTFLLILFLSRRKSKEVSSRFADWLVPILTMACVMMLKPGPVTTVPATVLSIVIQCLGMAFMTLSLVSLGRSLGIVPANRTIKCSGAYQWMRHPLYAGEMVFYMGFLIGNCTPYNSFLVVSILSGQIWRAFAEERLLLHDRQYRRYIRRVRFRFIPGLF